MGRATIETGETQIMDTYDYLAADYKTGKATLKNDFAGALTSHFDLLRDARVALLNATDEAFMAQAQLENAKAEVITGGLATGKNAEEREAKLDQIIKPVRDALSDKKRDLRLAEHNLQCASDNIRELQMLLDAVKSGMNI
jgi:hypothetical protein